MLPRNIDLTERRDFGDGTFTTLARPSFDLRHYDGPMGRDEYEYIVWWESVFGRESHDNEKYTVFDKNETYEMELETHCHRCGKELRIPWKRYYNLCEKCNYDVDYEYERLPWKAWKGSTSDGEPVSNARELFDLR